MLIILRGVASRFPSPIKAALVAIYDWIRNYSYRRWVRGVFSRENMARRERLFLAVAAFIHTNRPLIGYYFEFGCNQANTMRAAWDTFHHLVDLHYVGFDSFAGLPKIEKIDEQEIWAEGRYAIAEDNFREICTSHGIPNNRLITIKGFYDASLNEKTQKSLSGKKAVFIYIDCDLYHSTIPALEFCKTFLQPGTVIAFDDWNCFLADPNKGERRAWREFCERNPDLHFESMFETGMQKAFIYTGNQSQ